MMCNIFLETIEYFGHDIHMRRLKTASHMTTTIKTIISSQNVTELNLFLGGRTVFRQSFPKFWKNNVCTSR